MVMVAVVDASAAAAVITDDELMVVHATAAATELLGIAPARQPFDAALDTARFLRPTAVASAMRAALNAPGQPSSTYHVIESTSGEDRCVMLRPARMRRTPGRWVWWFDDITDATRLQRLQLLAEIGRAHGPEVSSADFAQHLVDRVCEVLGVDVAVVALGDEDRLRVSAVRGMFLRDGLRLRVERHPFLVKALATQRPLPTDGSEWGDGAKTDGSTHYIVPLVCTPDVFGTLHITFHEDDIDHYKRPPRLIDMVFLEALSTYAGAAIANMRLYEAARKERRYLQAVVENLPSGVILYNSRGKVLLTNDGARKITERDWSDLNSDSRGYKLRSADGQVLRRADWPFFRPQRDSAPILDEEVVLDFGDYRKVVAVSVTPIAARDDVAPTFVGTLRDITNERVRQLERDSFMHVLSHELRSPLTPLTGFLQMVRQQIEHGEDVDAQLLGRAQRQVYRLSRLLDSVLDLNQLERGLVLNRDMIDICELVTHTAIVWQSDPRGVKVELDIPHAGIIADVDGDRIDQVLTNLVDNAIKHSPPGDTVMIALSSEDDHAVLSVSDNGAGIPLDDQPRIFERFFTGPSGRGGLGIGLYVTRQIVRAHGGRVTVHSAPGDGTTFRVTLPTVSH